MKIGKWYIINELDKFKYEQAIAKELKEKLKYYEKVNYEQYKEIEELKEENEYLKNYFKIEIVNVEDNNG